MSSTLINNMKQQKNSLNIINSKNMLIFIVCFLLSLNMFSQPPLGFNNLRAKMWPVSNTHDSIEIKFNYNWPWDVTSVSSLVVVDTNGTTNEALYWGNAITTTGPYLGFWVKVPRQAPNSIKFWITGADTEGSDGDDFAVWLTRDTVGRLLYGPNYYLYNQPNIYNTDSYTYFDEPEIVNEPKASVALQYLPGKYCGTVTMIGSATAGFESYFDDNDSYYFIDDLSNQYPVSYTVNAGVMTYNMPNSTIPVGRTPKWIANSKAAIQIVNGAIAIGPGVPPTPTILDVLPTICQNTTGTKRGKITNWHSTYNLVVTQNGNPLSLNMIDTSFQYFAQGQVVGNYLNKISFTNSWGSFTKDTVHNVFINVPSITAPVASSTPYCVGTNNITFTTIPTNIGVNPTYTWKNGTATLGTSSVPTFTTGFSSAGLKKISVSVFFNNGGCHTTLLVRSDTTSITINSNTTASVTAPLLSAGPYCVGNPITFTTTPSNIGVNPTYTWQYGSIVVGTTNVPTFTTSFTNAASMNLSVSVSFLGGSNCYSSTSANSSATPFTINPSISPNLLMPTVSSSPYCVGSNITFTTTPINVGSSPIYTWKDGATILGSTTIPTFSTIFGISGTKNISVSVTFNAGTNCYTSTTVNSPTRVVTVNDIVTPSLLVPVTTIATFCLNNPITFTTTPTNIGTNPTYTWRDGATTLGTTTVPTFTTTFTTTGVKNINVSVSFSAGSGCYTATTASSANQSITVNDYQTPTVSYTFIGNGNWDVPSNWLNNLIPPATLPSGATIVIDPISGGECVLNIPVQTISICANIRVATGKKLRLPGKLTIN